MYAVERKWSEGEDTLESEAASRPLQIVVIADALKELALRALARQALACLRDPGRFTPTERQELTGALGRLLDAEDEEADAEGVDDVQETAQRYECLCDSDTAEEGGT